MFKLGGERPRAVSGITVRSVRHPSRPLARSAYGRLSRHDRQHFELRNVPRQLSLLLSPVIKSPVVAVFNEAQSLMRLTLAGAVGEIAR